MKQTIAYRKYSLNNDVFIYLPEEIFKAMTEHASRFYPNECGGVLIGKIVDNSAYIGEIILPQHTTSTPMIFKRIADFFNNALQHVFNNSKGKKYYLGEWHSHPNAPPIPSGTDLNAMKEIALNPHIRTRTPLLLIIQITTQKPTEIFYLYDDQKLHAYESI